MKNLLNIIIIMEQITCIKNNVNTKIDFIRKKVKVHMNV